MKKVYGDRGNVWHMKDVDQLPPDLAPQGSSQCERGHCRLRRDLLYQHFQAERNLKRSWSDELVRDYKESS